MSSHHVGKQPDKHLRAIQQALANLCVSVKMRSRGEKGNKQRWEEERGTLKDVDALLLVERLQVAIESLWPREGEEERRGKGATNDSRQEEPPQGYEQLIQQLEAEVRLHIRVNRTAECF